ncbi:hypothetical protein [Streptomyces sp. NPDC001153]
MRESSRYSQDGQPSWVSSVDGSRVRVLTTLMDRVNAEEDVKWGCLGGLRHRADPPRPDHARKGMPEPGR